MSTSRSLPASTARLPTSMAPQAPRASEARAKSTAEQILTGLLAAGTFEPQAAQEAPAGEQALPPAHERLRSRLEQLGVQGRGPGEVLQELRSLISGRGVTPERTEALQQALGRLAAGASGSTNLAETAEQQLRPYLDARQRAVFALQKASHRQAQGAALITTLRKSKSESDKMTIQNMK